MCATYLRLVFSDIMPACYGIACMRRCGSKTLVRTHVRRHRGALSPGA